ncbi:MAG: hypothetical protein GY808_07310 [Gammaproteobacteria bacterium]|nr:hypothetical protein [Gammaproteobacteria bacterium]
MDIFETYVTSMDFIDWGIPAGILFLLHFIFRKSEILKWTGVGGLLIAFATLVFHDIGWQTQWVAFFAFILWGFIRNRGANS